MSAGYIASARIERGRPHFVGAPSATARPSEMWQPCPVADTDDRQVVDAAPREAHDLELRFEALRERWSQLWFFVLDPESWR